MGSETESSRKSRSKETAAMIVDAGVSRAGALLVAVRGGERVTTVVPSRVDDQVVEPVLRSVGEHGVQVASAASNDGDRKPVSFEAWRFTRARRAGRRYSDVRAVSQNLKRDFRARHTRIADRSSAGAGKGAKDQRSCTVHPPLRVFVGESRRQMVLGSRSILRFRTARTTLHDTGDAPPHLRNDAVE
jgi:hypothetical protein